MTTTFLTVLAAEVGGAFVVSALAAVWARHGFRLPRRHSAAE